MDKLGITCLNVDCPERTGGKCNVLERTADEPITMKFSELQKLLQATTKKAEVRWKLAPDYPLYEVSSNGSVRNIKSNKVLKPHCNHKGYLSYTLLNKENIRKNVRANRLVLQVFEGQPQGDKQFACHKDGNQYNNHISNLYWGSHIDNAQDQIRLGVQAIGSRHGIAKLNEEDVMAIRQRLSNGERGAVIARDYKVDRGLIYKIRDNQIWELKKQPGSEI